MPLRKREFMSLAGKTISDKSYTVSIKHGGWTVEGISKNPFSFKLSAKYADLFNGLIPGAELLQKTGNASLTTGIFSQKYFQGGNNLDMNVEFRIFDDGKTDKNPVIEGAKNLARMTVANGINPESVPKNVEAALNLIFNKFKATQENVGKVLTGETELTEGVTKGIQSVIDGMSDRAVTLSIANVFSSRGMVIQDVTATYSGQQTHTGPLYGDFSVGLISLQAITRGSNSRYGIDGILKEGSFDILIDGVDSRSRVLYNRNNRNNPFFTRYKE